MNKIGRLLVLSSLVVILSGCNLSGGGSKKKASTSEQISSSDLSTSEKTSEPSQTITTSLTSDTTQTTTVLPTSESTTIPTTSTTAVPTSTSEPIHSGASFEVSGNALPFDNYGLNFDTDKSGEQNLSEKENVDKIKNSWNEQVSFILVEKLTLTKCAIQTDSGTAEQEHLHLTMGTGSYAGKIRINFTVPVKKITVSCRAYSKPKPDGYTVDTNALIVIEGESHNLETTSEGLQPLQTFSKELATAKSEIVINNTDEDQRVFIESIEIGY